MMKKTLLIALSMMLSLLSSAQTDALSVFRSKVLDSCVEFAYDFEAGLTTKLCGSGKAVLQGECFSVVGNGLDIKCDGKVVWTVDRSAKEALVESLEVDGANNIYANPALFITYMAESFTVKSQARATFDGKNCVKAVLLPKIKGDLSEITLYLSADGNILYGAETKVKDGTVTKFTIPSFSFVEKKPLSVFTVSESSFDKSYIITDLR